jgi:rRNA processing protein Gar1
VVVKTKDVDPSNIVRNKSGIRELYRDRGDVVITSAGVDQSKIDNAMCAAVRESEDSEETDYVVCKGEFGDITDVVGHSSDPHIAVKFAEVALDEEQGEEKLAKGESVMFCGERKTAEVVRNGDYYSITISVSEDYYIKNNIPRHEYEDELDEVEIRTADTYDGVVDIVDDELDVEMVLASGDGQYYFTDN